MKELQISSERNRQRPKVIIVGGGFGGLYAAKSLANEPVDVLLIDRKNHHTFQPLLYQVALAVLAPGDISASLRGILRAAFVVNRPRFSAHRFSQSLDGYARVALGVFQTRGQHAARYRTRARRFFA